MAAVRAWYLNVALLGLAWFGAAGENLDWKMELEWDGAWSVQCNTRAIRRALGNSNWRATACLAAITDKFK